MACVLVAEDDRLLSMLLEEILRSAGHEPRHAFDGCEALELLRAPGARFELAVIDLVMPRLDGAQLIEICRREFPAMPLLLTSGYSREYVFERLGERLPDHFLPKPWDADELAAVVSALLAGRDRP